MKKRYLTTAIDYANGSPHIGHAYEKILADTIARSWRLQDIPCYFLTGLDEHGQKVAQSAQKQGISPQDFCDRVANEWQDFCRRLQLSNDAYIRTSDENHKKTVQKILQQLHDRGEIYSSTYHGFYCPRSEQFVQEKDKIDGQWPSDFGEVFEVDEQNYFFRLSKHQQWLIDYLGQHPDFIYPAWRQKQVLEFLREPLNDLCTSRPKERLQWGIELPFDRDYVTYVWFDALLNYLSATGWDKDGYDSLWPADYHIIGKDILVPAHAIYWPIMLHVLGLPLPHHLLVHGWWLAKDGEKMSKSLGNTINPLDCIEKFGIDAFRYFLLREMSLGQDSNFSLELFQNRYRGELANDLGNLVSRLNSMIHRYCNGITPAQKIIEKEETNLRQLWETTAETVLNHYRAFDFSSGLESLFIFIRAINRYTEIQSPWKLAKENSSEARDRLETTLATMAEGLRLATSLLLPIMPLMCKRIFSLIGSKTPIKWENNLVWADILSGQILPANEILFPRLDEK